MAFVLPDVFSFRVNFFNSDKLLDDHDFVFVTLYVDKVPYSASLHYPKGKLIVGDRYDGKAGAWIKGMYKGNLQVVLGKKDPAAGKDYTLAGTAKKLPV